MRWTLKICFRTKVPGDYLKIFKAFDQQLFEFLKPPYQFAELVRFDGSNKGDLVHLRFKIPYKADWISEIIEQGSDEHKCYFIDLGKTLPFGLKHWRHEHIIRRAGIGDIIEDNITFNGSNWMVERLLYPGLWLTFFLRKKQYRTYFNDQK